MTAVALADAELIGAECDALKALLIEKSNAYGSSWRDPLRVFSAADTVEQLRVRIDDKLSRIKRGGMTAADGREEDVVLDLLGYLVLYRIATRRRVAEAHEEMGQPDQREDRERAIPEWKALRDAERRRLDRVLGDAATFGAVADAPPTSEADEELVARAVRAVERRDVRAFEFYGWTLPQLRDLTAALEIENIPVRSDATGRLLRERLALANTIARVEWPDAARGGCAEVSKLHDPAFWEEELARHDTLSMDSAEDRATLARAIAANVRDHSLGVAYAEGYAEGYAEETKP